MRYLLIVPLLLLTACGGGEANNAPERTPQPSNREEIEPPAVSQKDKERAAGLSREVIDLINAHDNTAAAEKAELAIQLDPEVPEYQAQLAYVYEKLGRYDDALEWYLNAGERFEGEERSRTLRGAARCANMLAEKERLTGNLDAAQQFAEQAIELDGSEPRYRLELGHVYFTRKDYARAAIEYDLAASVSIGDAELVALDWKGRTQFHAGEYRPAIATFTQLIDRGAKGLETYGWRAYSYMQIGDKQRAISDFTQAVQRTDDKAKRAEYEDALRQLTQLEDEE